jgi:hypothetical protein
MHNMTICICSDSKAALLALTPYTISSKLLHQCWLSLQNLSNYNRVRFFWVPGHCDIKGNEEADRLTRMGSDSHFCGTEVSASAILRFAFIKIRDKPRIRRLLTYDSINVLFLFFLSFYFFYFIVFRLISLFTSHLGEHIRPKQRPACKSSTFIRRGLTLPSIHPTGSLHSPK